MAVISQSEVDTFLTCRRRHFYAHGEKIQPVQYGTALTRGTIGHEAIAAAFTAMKNGERSRENLVVAALTALQPHMTLENAAIIKELSEFLAYFFRHADWIYQWEILEVEKEYRIPVPGHDELTFPFKVDLLIRDRSQGNRIYVVDNKFVQDFYADDLIGLLPQLAKYTGGLRSIGIQVHDAYYNMIRTRPLKNKPVNEKIKLVRCNISDKKVKHYLREQYSAMLQIHALNTQVDLSTWRDTYALRTANQFTCRTCPFRDLCYLDLEDGDRDLHIKAFYKPNEYGYTEEVTE